ncbi:sulfotransferase family 2 domain-containing protein [Microcoleus sp. F4-D5]|uniref:sulfotransferase family 2 domain-containing protein n=1 Tax=Microcoleus sp. F4-D5 TaxID=2818760 RepID=UPI002FD248E7
MDNISSKSNNYCLEGFKADLLRARSSLRQFKKDLNSYQQPLASKSQQTSNLSVEIVSVHIPKTAGSSFGNILTKIYGEEHCYLDYEPSLVNLDVITSKHKVIHGHLATRFVTKFPTAKIIVWIRNPIVRLVSDYYYIFSRPIEVLNQSANKLNKDIFESNLSLEQFAEIPGRQNVLNQYCKLDRDYFFIGIQEFFDDDITDLTNLLHWPKIELEQVNETTHPKYKHDLKALLCDKKLISKIVSLNQKDMELYQSCLELRAKRKRMSLKEMMDF